MRRTMVSLRGFQPPRPSGEHPQSRTATGPNESSTGSGAKASTAAVPSASTGSSPRRSCPNAASLPTSQPSSVKGKKTRPKNKSGKQPGPSATARGTPATQSPRSSMTFGGGAAAAPVLGGHFSANRRLMEQVKETRRETPRRTVGVPEAERGPSEPLDRAALPPSGSSSVGASQASSSAPPCTPQPGAPSFLSLALQVEREAERGYPLPETPPSWDRKRTRDAHERGDSGTALTAGDTATGGGAEGEEETPTPSVRPRLEAPLGWGDTTAPYTVSPPTGPSSLSPSTAALAPSSSAGARSEATSAAAVAASGREGSRTPSHTEGGFTSSLFLVAFEQAQQCHHPQQQHPQGPSLQHPQTSGALPLAYAARNVEGEARATEEAYPWATASPAEDDGVGPRSQPSSQLQSSGNKEEERTAELETHTPLFTEVPEAALSEDDEALEREVEEDLRLSEDLPFTPHRSSGMEGAASSQAGSAQASQNASYYHNPFPSRMGSQPSLYSAAPLHTAVSRPSTQPRESVKANEPSVPMEGTDDPFPVGLGAATPSCGEPQRGEVLLPPSPTSAVAEPPKAPVITESQPLSMHTSPLPLPPGGENSNEASVNPRKRTVFIFTSSTTPPAAPQSHAIEGPSSEVPVVTLTATGPPSSLPTDVLSARSMAPKDVTEPEPLTPPPPPPLQLFVPTVAAEAATTGSGEVPARKRTRFTLTSAPAPSAAMADATGQQSDPLGIADHDRGVGDSAGDQASPARAVEGVPADPIGLPEDTIARTEVAATVPPITEEGLTSPGTASPPLAAAEAATSAGTPPPQPLEPPLWYDLPPTAELLFANRRGVKKLYDWQHQLLSRDDVRQGGSFVYSMPTSGGKTLVAEISLLRCVLNKGQSAFFVVPFVSLAEEKTSALRPFGEVLGFAVEGHYGTAGRFPLPESPAVFVCTIEKANSLLNHLLEEGRGSELGAVVVDELHMLGEPRRGATLELFLSKLLLLSAPVGASTVAAAGAEAEARGGPGTSAEEESSEKAEHIKAVLGEDSLSVPPLEWIDPHEVHSGLSATATATAAASSIPSPRVQIIGMSATIPNLNVIARWLHAALYEGTERPVPLRQYSVVDGLVLRDGDVNERNLNGRTEVDCLFELTHEEPDASVLIFCASRQQCVDTAKGLVLYAKRMATANSPGLSLTTAADQVRAAAAAAATAASSSSASAPGRDPLGPVKPNASAAVAALVDELQGLGSYSEATMMAELVQYGVAFHHGGLLAEEREAIETAYRHRLVRVLCCTSTLAAGVNLPARRVIFKTPYIGREFLTKSRYLQMCGRAGRAGLDAYGESFLLLSRRDRDRGHRLMRQGIEPCQSQLLEEAGHLPRALLECVTVGLIQTPAAAITGWAVRLLASWAQGPIDVAFEAALVERFGPLQKESTEETATGKEASLRETGTESGGGHGGSLAEDSNAAVHASSLLPPESGGRGGESPSLAGAAARAPEGEPAPTLRRQAYIKALQQRRPAADILSALLQHSLTTIAEAGLVNLTEEDREEKPDVAALPLPVPLRRQYVRPTPFGASAVRSCFSVEEALLVRDELENLRRTGLILGDDLHLCYFLTPLREVGDCDWQTYSYLVSHFTESQQRIAALLGVNEQFIMMRAMGLGGGRSLHDVPTTAEGKRDFFTARRFYVALMLSDVLSEVPMEEVEARYNVRRGQLQSLMRSASMFSSSITSFCRAMEWFSLEAVLASFVKRLGFGVKPDLVPLMEIRNVQPGRARALWNAGYKTPKLIAACEDPDEMVRRVKALNAPDSKTAKFFSRRSALALIREANLLLEYQIREKREELQLLTGRHP